jgi:hypothetical protein
VAEPHWHIVMILQCGSATWWLSRYRWHRDNVTTLHRGSATLPHCFVVAPLHRDSVTYRAVFDPRRSLVPWLTTLPLNLDVRRAQPMCWYCRTNRGPWEDEQQVAVSRGEGGPRQRHQ